LNLPAQDLMQLYLTQTVEILLQMPQNDHNFSFSDLAAV